MIEPEDALPMLDWWVWQEAASGDMANPYRHRLDFRSRETPCGLRVSDQHRFYQFQGCEALPPCPDCTNERTA